MTPKPSARIAEIRERLIEEQVEIARLRCLEAGFGADHPDTILSSNERGRCALQAIIEYLDERDAEEKVAPPIKFGPFLERW